MATSGYFGKVPARPDYIFQGLPMRASDAWAIHLTGWLSAARKTAQADWKTRFLTSPVWRFAVSAHLFGPESWVGLLAGSLDSVGREFPFIVMMSADLDLTELQPVQLIDQHLDPLEEVTLAFIEEQASQRQLVEAIRSAASAMERDFQIPPLQAQGLVIPREDHDAVCFSQPSDALGLQYSTAYSWPAARDNKQRGSLCLWWHDGSDDRPADYCVTRGMPQRMSAAAFFLGDWEAHGWERHDAAAYLGAA